jgi:hypothetical protein
MTGQPEVAEKNSIHRTRVAQTERIFLRQSSV